MILADGTAAAYVEDLRQLFREYARELNVDLSFQAFEEELTSLPGVYAPPSGRLLIAMEGGACYLIWIGLRMVIARSTPAAVAGVRERTISHKRIFWEGFLSDALNPKVAVFFLALLPQFVTRSSTLGTTTQLLILGITSNVVAICLNVIIVVFASAATSAIRKRTGWITWLNRATGAVLIGLGLRLAREKI